MKVYLHYFLLSCVNHVVVMLRSIFQASSSIISLKKTKEVCISHLLKG